MCASISVYLKVNYLNKRKSGNHYLELITYITFEVGVYIFMKKY